MTLKYDSWNVGDSEIGENKCDKENKEMVKADLC